jgi:hypothetical protein
MSAERLLTWILRAAGCVLLSATLFAFMPSEWMARTHEALGMGPFPDAPLTQYLTRSIAALYAVHGAFFLLAASDVRRYRSFVRLIGATDMAFGATMFGIDLHAGMPRSWTWGEGPSLLLIGALVLALSGRVTPEAR